MTDTVVPARLRRVQATVCRHGHYFRRTHSALGIVWRCVRCGTLSTGFADRSVHPVR